MLTADRMSYMLRPDPPAVQLDCLKFWKLLGEPCVLVVEAFGVLKHPTDLWRTARRGMWAKEEGFPCFQEVMTPYKTRAIESS